ncbi:cache domain-containing protein [Paenibacillus puerhi]|uniref:cache domain-containing protein n=1 Tax=Paenibacillus puerhi TaxID=2692622 RepID=UPI001358483C|nr:cache domain-containing protein [Paenibacillus puerhi]
MANKSKLKWIFRLPRFSFKRIQTKFLVYILPALLVSMIILCWVSYSFSKDTITTEIEHKMANQMDATVQNIRNKLSSHVRIPQTVARMIETSGQQLSKEGYKELLLNIPSLNRDTLGVGVYYEPYRYDSGVKYFAPYAYKDGNTIVYTDEYASNEYNYPQWEWYQNGKLGKEVVFTDPYFDKSLNRAC